MTKRSDAEIMQSSLGRAYVGGGYYNPVEEFAEIAHSLDSEQLRYAAQELQTISLVSDGTPSFVISNIYRELRDMLADDEVLFGMYETSKYRFAVLIHCEERLLDFESQVASNRLVWCGFYSLERHRANEGLMRVFLPPSLKFRSETDKVSPRLER